MDRIPICQVCGELEIDNACGARGAFHKCTRSSLLRQLARNAEDCRYEILHGYEDGAFLRARNAYWYAREAGLLTWAPEASPGGRIDAR